MEDTTYKPCFNYELSADELASKIFRLDNDILKNGYEKESLKEKREEATDELDTRVRKVSLILGKELTTIQFLDLITLLR